MPSSTHVQAREQFNLQYAGMLGGPTACEATFASFRLEPHQLQLTGTMIGAGNFGAVELAVFQAPNSHRGWKALGVGGGGGGGGGASVATKSKKQHHVQKFVAVKMLRSSGDTDLLRTFLLEARLLCNLSHMHIVRAVGVVDERLPLILVTEYCEGGNLRDYLRSGDVPRAMPSRLAGQMDMACQVASAVAYLHSMVCLHRDLAARNVLVSLATAGGDDLPICGVVLKLADLGLARVLSSETDYYRVSV